MVNEDIDAIILRGEELTAEPNNKLERESIPDEPSSFK